MNQLAEFLKVGLQDLLDAFPAQVFVKDENSRLVLINRTCEEAWGLKTADIYGTDGSQFFPADQMQKFLSEDRQILESGESMSVVEVFRNHATGQDRIGHTFKRVLGTRQGKGRYLIGITLDITERSRAESSMHALDERLRALFSFAPLGIALTAMDGRFLEFNKEFENLCGYSKDELLALDYWALTPPEYQAQEQQQLEALQLHGVYGPYEKDYVRKDGTRLSVQLNGALIHDAEGTPLIWSIVQDISGRKRELERNTRLLREREALLQEVHHRVKNNLQVISSLLRLESNRSAESQTREVLQGMQGRIQSMALVHELLYRTGNYAQVDLHAYIAELAGLIARMQGAREERIQLAMALDPVQVPMNIATPCGLLVNELISNAYRHAFSDGHSGQILIELAQTRDARSFSLSVGDNGKGLPEGFGADHGNTLGLQLVRDLAQQMGSRLQVQTRPHTRFTVEVTVTPAQD